MVRVVELINGGIAVDRPTWRYVNDAHRLLEELSQLADVLPQLLEEISDAVRHQLELNLIAMDTGSLHQDRPDAAVQTSRGSPSVCRSTQPAT